MGDRVKIVGYAQRVFYDNGIEYRNFSDDLVGLQQTSPTALFTSGNFTIETNFDEKIDKSFISKKFSPFITLEDLKVSQEQSLNIQKSFNDVSLNLNKSNLDYYAYFGSLVEFIRVSLEHIIMNWPASLYITQFDEFTSESGYTIDNNVYNLVKDESTFNVDINRIVNKFNINHKINGTTLNTYNETNDTRNLTINYTDYVITFKDETKEHPIIGFTGNTDDINDNLTIKVKGDILSGITQTTKHYHIKPKSSLHEEFFTTLPDFEAYLLNRFSLPKYKAKFDFKTQSETGTIINSSREVIWPVSDGYNIDFDTQDYIEFVQKLIKIGEQSDLTKTNLMVRELVSTSISDFDTLPNCDGEFEETAGQKMNRTIKIYGRQYDEIKKHIDGIAFANTVSYDKKDNTPNLYLKNIARVMGWELISSVLENDLLKTFLEPKDSTYSGQSIGYTAYEAEIELWRRIILNTPWIWKSKGTRKSIDFFLKFIGTPEGLITFNEYVYKAKNPIDMDMFTDILFETYGDGSLDGLNLDSDGFPRVFPNTPQMYFQQSGLWYRETGGSNSNIDILEGNNPHIGPYDGGQSYINQFGCLIPDFEPVTITNQTINTSEINIFTNYNSGLVNNSLDSTVYTTIVNSDNISLSPCFEIIGEIIEDPKPTTELTDCGCETGEGDDAIKLSIKKKDIMSNEPTPSDCGYTGFKLNEGGYIVFELSNGNETTNTTKQCCEALGFTYEGGSNISCWWKDNTTVDSDIDIFTIIPTDTTRGGTRINGTKI